MLNETGLVLFQEILITLHSIGYFIKPRALFVVPIGQAVQVCLEGCYVSGVEWSVDDAVISTLPQGACRVTPPARPPPA